MNLLTQEQKNIIVSTFYHVHEAIRKQNWNELYTAFVSMECTPDEIMWEIRDYPGTVTKCTLSEFTDGVLIEEDGFTERGFLCWASVWLDGVRSDLSMEGIFEFHENSLSHMTLTQVHVF